MQRGGLGDFHRPRLVFNIPLDPSARDADPGTEIGTGAAPRRRSSRARGDEGPRIRDTTPRPCALSPEIVPKWDEYGGGEQKVYYNRVDGAQNDDQSSGRYVMRKTVLVLVGCLALTAAPAWAGGAFSLFGTYGQVNDHNNSLGAGARLSLGGESIRVDLTGTWYPRVNGIVVQDRGDTIYGGIQIIPFDLGLRWVFARGSELRPYVGAGASYVFINLNSGDADDETGFYGLAGLQIMGWGSGGLFVEGTYRWFDGNLNIGGVEYEESIGGLSGSIGVTFNF